MLLENALIAELSADALERLADAHLEFSERLRAAARDKAAALAVQRQARSRVSALRALPDIVAGYRAAGMTAGQAISAAAISAGVNPETVEAHIRAADRKEERRERRARDAEIARLHTEGLPPARIAEIVGVHRETVHRVLRRIAR